MHGHFLQASLLQASLLQDHARFACKPTPKNYQDDNFGTGNSSAIRDRPVSLQEPGLL